MRERSDAEQSIYETTGVLSEHRITISGTVYDQSKIVSAPVISRTLYAGRGPGIGGAVAAEIELQVFPDGTIPRMAEIVVESRLITPAGEATGWWPMGVFFIGTRQLDRVSGVLTIHGYDAMVKADQTYLLEGDVGEWPRSMPTVATEIAQRMGVEIDARTLAVLNPAYMVELPTEMTMREVLQGIAAAHGANWCITEEGKLRLVTFGTIRKTVSYLVDEHGNAITFGGIRIIV